MGSATREALVSARAALTAQGGTADLATGEALLAAARVIGSSPQLLTALSDNGAEPEAKKALVSSVFSSTVTPAALALLGEVAAARWSDADDVLEGIEDLGLRVVAASSPAGTDVDAELFAFGRTVSSNAELELALSSKLGSNEAKASLVDTLLAGKASTQAVVILSHLVQQPRGRRIGELVRYAASVVAAESGYAVATVTSATVISDAQVERLAAGLSAKYGRDLRINQVVDPSVIGGLRVQVGDDIIDGSVAKRLDDVRLQLAG
ncbi:MULTISPECIES: F0F1 ATP synthase subunit delta [Microbacteriaceae]|uniref:ATP synthase subunit delta n=1 Tax=Orlajensenia leifsoniae TaxID=2561933 RepID=A0A4Y9QYJ6_9MICO|nr:MULTISPECIES: F0F1 ATP synthase subunit delta [Leifsonia]KQQ95723.1 ATP synthase F0F1 subunit delta [Leifsonia sp. Leaf325]TFV96393.1 F0F1 ATP synthase subunit delta [Leifsonia flava]